MIKPKSRSLRRKEIMMTHTHAQSPDCKALPLGHGGKTATGLATVAPTVAAKSRSREVVSRSNKGSRRVQVEYPAVYENRRSDRERQSNFVFFHRMRECPLKRKEKTPQYSIRHEYMKCQNAVVWCAGVSPEIVLSSEHNRQPQFSGRSTSPFAAAMTDLTLADCWSFLSNIIKRLNVFKELFIVGETDSS